MTKKKTEESSFVFYRSFYEVIHLIPDEAIRGRAFTALCEYAFSGIEPADDADVLVKMVFTQAKPQIDANNRRRENGRIGGKASKKTEGEPSENNSETNDKQIVSKRKQTQSSEEANVNANVNVNDNDNVNANQNINENGNVCLGVDEPGVSQENGTDSVQTDRPTVFIPPTLAQVQSYAAKKQLDIDAEYFVEYYTANGWMTGKEAVRDWKALLRSWARQEKRWNQRKEDTQNVNDKQKGDKDSGKMERIFGIWA